MSDDNFPDASFGEAPRQARAWLERDPLFLDTETTGLGADAQVCELAVLDARGQACLVSLIRPTILIPIGATAVHGLTDADVAAAPSFVQVLPQLRDLLTGRLVVIYNADYDLRLLAQSARAHGVVIDPQAVCAMELYAAFCGDWDAYHQSYRWQKLGAAARQCRLTLPPDLHRAHADAELCRLVVRHMAGQPLPGDET